MDDNNKRPAMRRPHSAAERGSKTENTSTPRTTRSMTPPPPTTTKTGAIPKRQGPPPQASAPGFKTAPPPSYTGYYGNWYPSHCYIVAANACRFITRNFENEA